jgi:hypothetical protein
MPELRRFAGFKLLMFFQDENPPRVHIKGPDFCREAAYLERPSACRLCTEQDPQARWMLDRSA